MMRRPGLFEQHVKSVALAAGLIAPNDRVLAAVSGGPDSVALLLLLRAWQEALNLTLAVVHIHHGIRGLEADGDAAFADDLGSRLGVPVFTRRVEVLSAGKKINSSLQALAREKRYEALSEAGCQWQADRIALGHTQDDQAETVLLWMIRGAGSQGLAGMSSHRTDKFIRPLLHVPRAEILDYLAAKGTSFREDTSNAKPIYLRNRVRQELVPMLRRFNPSITRTLSRQATILRDETDYLDRLATTAFESVTEDLRTDELIVKRPDLLMLPVALQRRVVAKAFQYLNKAIVTPRFDAVQEVIDQVLHGQSGSRTTRGSFEIMREYDRLCFRSRDSQRGGCQARQPVCIPVAVGQPIVWPLTGQTIRANLTAGPVDAIPTDRYTALFDAAAISRALTVRTWQNGDVFCPSGLHGKKKKIQDFFSDIKLSASKRRAVPILVAPEGIVWVGGYRADERFQVTRDTTEILTATISRESE